MKRLAARFAAAASAVVLALNMFAVSASAAKDKKKKTKTEDSSAAETVVEEGSAPDGEDGELEDDLEEDERDKENFHRSGAWGYTLLADNTASISKYYGDSTHPAVPSEIDGFTVSALSGGWYADQSGSVVIYGNIHGLTFDDSGMISGSSVYSPFSGDNKITEITLPDTVKYIGAISFKGCKKLKKVNIGSGVLVIGNNCFENCPALETVNFPENIAYFDQSAFAGCTALKEIKLPEAHYEAAVFEGCTALEKVVIGKTDSIPQYMFSGCTSLTGAAVPEGARSIGDSAFAGCTSLKTITLPESVKEIRNNAFSGCTSLETVNVGSKTESIGSSAFADCPLKDLTLPDSLTKIGKTAFGMKSDGKPIEGFRIICPEYSPAQSYAENNGLAVETVKGELPVRTASEEDSEESQPEEETQAPAEIIDSDLMFKLLLGIIALTALAVIVAVILIIKNHRLGDGPEEEEYFPGDDYDEESDMEDSEFGQDGQGDYGGYDDDSQDWEQNDPDPDGWYADGAPEGTQGYAGGGWQPDGQEEQEDRENQDDQDSLYGQYPGGYRPESQESAGSGLYDEYKTGSQGGQDGSEEGYFGTFREGWSDGGDK